MGYKKQTQIESQQKFCLSQSVLSFAIGRTVFYFRPSGTFFNKDQNASFDCTRSFTGYSFLSGYAEEITREGKFMTLEACS